MLPLLPIFVLGQAISVPSPIPPGLRQVVQQQEVRALPGQLDKVPVFNSNSPEVVQTEGILLSTFPSDGKAAPQAHLNLPLDGRFDVFAHHLTRSRTSRERRPLYMGVLVNNPGSQPVTLEILQAVSYVSTPDAPFIDLPPSVENPLGKVFSGPGSRLMNDMLRGIHQSDFPSRIEIPPRENRMLFNLPIRPGTTRSTMMRLRSNRPVYMASLAMYARLNSDKSRRTPRYRAPMREEWQTLLIRGELVEPRDRPPTPLDQLTIDMIYGRVAGVAQGSEWRTVVTDGSGKDELTIPERGKAFSYPVSTVDMATFGTRQVQSAPMLVRYPDTAYRAHGNYGVHYNLAFPLVNTTGQAQTVTLALQTPLQQEDYNNGLQFLEPPDRPVFFRGTIQVSYKDDQGVTQTRYVHLVQRRGQQGKSLVTLKMPPDDRRLVKLEFRYPPDATPPQVVTVRTLERSP